MAYQLKEINDRIQREPAAFMAECDAHYQKRISTAVDKILARSEEHTSELQSQR